MQYLTKVQGMPTRIEDAPIKTTHQFMWDGHAPQISLQHLARPKAKGGVKLLNIRAQNQAIQLMWLHTYLDTLNKRPIWTFIVDALINHIILPKVDSIERMNLFLQMWDAPTKGLQGSRLPTYIREMLTTAKKFNVHFTAVKISQDLKEKMPAWHHLGLTPRQYRKRKSKCILNNHTVSMIIDMIKLAERTKHPETQPRRHVPQ